MVSSRLQVMEQGFIPSRASKGLAMAHALFKAGRDMQGV
jgi:hypothetical protein